MLKQCEHCGTEFETKQAKLAKYCKPCRPLMQRKKIDEARARRGVRVGVGSGNAQGNGVNHHSYKNGISVFIKYSREAKVKIRFCERCGKDLLYAASSEWATHHRDHDRSNNVVENFEFLCKRCHQLEHDCASALKVQRLFRKEVGNSVPEAPDILQIG